MRMIVGLFLVVLQCALCTLGQGALTVCVRKDGSQRLQWTASEECQTLQSPSHAGCGHDLCCHDEDEWASTDPAFRCDPCTDYVLVTEPMVVSPSKPWTLAEPSNLLCWYLPVSLDSTLSHLSLSTWAPGDEASACAGKLYVVLRC